METKFNFNSAICTSLSQSERLIALGLKKETADMSYQYLNQWDGWFVRPIEEDEKITHIEIPAWSLHRLIEMMPTLIGWRDKQYWLDVNNDGVCYSTSMSCALVEFIADNLYDNIIFCIEWLIKKGYFNKEYLNGHKD